MKIAIAIIHGVGITRPDYATGTIADLKRRFAETTKADPDAALAFRPVYWAPVLQRPEFELWRRLQQGGRLEYKTLRRFMVNFVADAFAYQPADHKRDQYEAIHAVVARGLRALADIAGRDAPLVVIAHSLGTIVASNFFYDLSRSRSPLGRRVLAAMHLRRGPLEKGETLTCLFTLGSPLALWSLRYRDFGSPLNVPSPKLATHHRALVRLAGWENYYDPNDILGFPLKKLNPAYGRTVTRDVPVSVGGMLTRWNPLSHRRYLTDKEITAPIAARLAALWQARH